MQNRLTEKNIYLYWENSGGSFTMHGMGMDNIDQPLNEDDYKKGKAKVYLRGKNGKELIGTPIALTWGK